MNKTKIMASSIDWTKIEKKYDLSEEIRDGWTVTEKTKKIWYVEMQLALRLIEVCKKHNLTCVAAAGTMLGAIRHNGFIPWDNDMDFFMPRKDYNLLCYEYSNEFSYPYFLQTAQSDRTWFRGHACLRDSRTTCISPIDRNNKDCNLGIYIDIFPLDGEPVDKSKVEQFMFRSQVRFLKALCLGMTYGNNYYSCKSKFTACILKTVSSIWLTLSDRKKLDSKYHKLCSKYSNDTNRPVRQLSTEYKPGDRTDYSYDYADIFTTMDHSFENMVIPIPVKYDKCLRIPFGDYMELPPIEKRANNEEQMNPDLPYENN